MSTAPAPIRKLEASVINRIAAGEIINRPSNALKELLENALDAGATSISISAKDGGLKSLQIQDNGHGIRKEDLPLVCERFTTSKLKTYDDLSSIQTYGFRGEALASISHVSHLSITTKTADSECAYKASYSDGRLVPSKAGGSSDPEPCAGNTGTILVAEDLFYNIPSRKTALKNTREEYNRIFEVASRYAIHNAGVAFSCRKVGMSKTDLNTMQNASAIANIRHIFGTKVAGSLVDVAHADSDVGYQFKGLVSGTTHEMPKTIFLLFINHRLVEHTPIKKAIESLYASVTPKASRPFAYLDLQIKPENIDVNVHPTKREVRFLNEDTIIAAIVDCIQKKLVDTNDSKSFSVQVPLQRQTTTILELSRGADSIVSSADTLANGSNNSYQQPEETAREVLNENMLSSPSMSARRNPLLDSRQPTLSSMFSSTPTPRTPILPSTPTSARKTPVNRTVRTDYKTLALDSFAFGASPSIQRNGGGSSNRRVQQTTIEPDLSLSPTRRMTANANTGSPRDPLHPSPTRPRQNTTNTEDSNPGLGMASPPDDRGFGPGRALFSEMRPSQQTQQQVPSLTAPSNQQDSMAEDIELPVAAAPEKQPQTQLQQPQALESAFTNASGSDKSGKSHVATKKDPRVEVRLTSIINLRKELQRHAHPELTQIFNEHSFVGFVDDSQALIQHQTRLFMVNYCKLSYHLFYHRCMFDFMNYGRLELDPAPSIYDLALIAANEMGSQSPEKSAKEVATRFSDSREMLEEYYHIKVSDTGTIETLPMIIRDYSPDYDKLPFFLYNAANTVDWEDEQKFFKSFTNVLATLYTLEPPLTSDCQTTKDEYRQMVEHRIMPALKGGSFWAPNTLLLENTLVQLADLPDLYRIFERC